MGRIVGCIVICVGITMRQKFRLNNNAGFWLGRPLVLRAVAQPVRLSTKKAAVTLAGRQPQFKITL